MTHLNSLVTCICFVCFFIFMTSPRIKMITQIYDYLIEIHIELQYSTIFQEEIQYIKTKKVHLKDQKYFIFRLSFFFLFFFLIT